MLLPMAKVQIIGTKDKIEPTIRELHRLGAVQIEDATRSGGALVLPRMTLDTAALARREEIGLLVTRLEALLALLPPQPAAENLSQQYQDASRKPTEDLVAEARKALEEVGDEAHELAVRRDELQSDQIALPRYAATIRKFMPLTAALPELASHETAALLIERRFSAVVDLIRQELISLIGDQFELAERDVDEETTAAILVFPREKSAQVNSLLGRENISQVRLPKELSGVSFKDALATIAARLGEIPAQLDSIRDRLEELGLRWHHLFTLLRAVLRDRLQELEIVGRLGATQYTFVLVGWVPRRCLGELQETLAGQVGKPILISELKVSKEEMKHAPVVLANPTPAQPFEFLVRLLALPQYGALDPTAMMALFMPIFFGMILGDVGYGILLLFIAAYLLRRFPSGALHSLARVLIYCGISAVMFGFLFGEFLGSIGRQVLHMKPLWMERGGASLTPLLVFAIAVGVVHVMLGLILGIWGALRRQSGKELSERLGKMVALVAMFWLVGVLSKQLPREFLTPGVVLLIVGIVLLSAPLGWVGILLGPIEALGVLGNVLSYLRLAAIGLSSFYLAEIANRFYGIVTNIVVSVIIASLLHALNLALGIVSPTIQSLRLHYVEFFTKFYEGGGEAFKPFKQTGV